MREHEQIDYLELPANDFNAAQVFYTEVFGWTFESAGPDYLAFTAQSLDGGFYRSNLRTSVETGATLVIFYSRDLEATQQKIISAQGIISKATFEFPGGRRFHFLDPNGNEFAVWSERDQDGQVFQ